LPAADADKPEWFTPEDNTKRQHVFLVTFAAVLEETALRAELALRTLEGVTREVVRDALLDAVAHPAEHGRAGGRPRARALQVEKLVVFLEEPRHFHAALKLNDHTTFLALKVALRRRSGFASHWGTTHAMFWSAVRQRRSKWLARLPI